MPNTIVTEKIARRGVRVPAEYAADFLDQVLVRDAASRGVVTHAADHTVADVRAWTASGASGTSHQGFPVVDGRGDLIGVVTRRDLNDPANPPERRIRQIVKRPPAVAYDDSSLREAAAHWCTRESAACRSSRGPRRFA